MKEQQKPVTKAQQLEAAVTFIDPIGKDITYTHALFSQCCLPVNKPKTDRWTVKHGKVGFSIDAGRGPDLEVLQVPYGSYARIAFAHIHNKIIRSGSLDTACQVDLGDSMRCFFSENGMNIGGRQGALLRQQIMNIAQANITFSFFGSEQKHLINVPRLASKIDFWLEKDDQQQTQWQPQIMVSREYAELIRHRAVPLDMRARMGMLAEGKRGAARAIDIYDWLAYRLPMIRGPKGVFIPFEGPYGLHGIFGIEIKAAKKFKQQFVESLKLAVKYYPGARVSLEENGIRLFYSSPVVPYDSNKPVYLSGK